jgi:hypothetical protein
MNTDNGTFENPMPGLKSPILFFPFMEYEDKCKYCEIKYSKTAELEQKYCKNCLFQYIKYTKNNDTFLDTCKITINAQCVKHEADINNFNTMNIQEWCEYCSEVSYFGQIIPNTLSFTQYYFSMICIHNKIDEIDCELCDKLWLSYSFKYGQDRFQVSSGWVESTLTKKFIPILYLPWWDNCCDCVVCYQKLDYIHQESEFYCQKWCSNCFIIYAGCRYCLTTNIIFGIIDRSKCEKCKGISLINVNVANFSSGDCIVDEFLYSTRINDNNLHLIADYMNETSLISFNVYKFIKRKFRTRRQVIKWIPYSHINNLRKIAEGGFSIIYKAIWYEGGSTKDVAIKKLHDSHNISKSMLNEVIVYYVNIYSILLLCISSIFTKIFII